MRMEFDDLHEPADIFVPGGRFMDKSRPHIQRHCIGSTIVGHCIGSTSVPIASSFGRFFSQPEVRPSDIAVVRHLDSAVSRSEARSIAKVQVQRPLGSKSVSLPSDPPVMVKLEDDLEDPLEPFSEQRSGLRMRDDLDELLTQPPPQRTRRELVDDLDEPEDLSQASKTEFHDDLHEPVEPPPPAGTTHDVHDDLGDPVVCMPNNSEINGDGLFDDLEETVATLQPPHREGTQSHWELQDDLDDPDEARHGSSPSDASSKLDHLYDDLDELLVDELISEVSDLVIQRRGLVRNLREQDRGDFGSQLEEPSANPATRHSSADPVAVPSLHAADVTPVIRRSNTELQVAATHQTAGEQATTLERSDCTSTGEMSMSGSGDGASPGEEPQRTHYVKGQQMRRYFAQQEQYAETEQRSRAGSRDTGTQQTVIGSNTSRRPVCVVSAAGDGPKWSARSQSEVAELQTTENSAQSAKTSSKQSSRQVGPACIISQNARGRQVRPQLYESSNNPQLMHSNTPANDSISNPRPPFNFPPNNTESPPSPPQSPLLLPRCLSPKPTSPPLCLSEVVLPPPSLPLLSGTPSQHNRPPPPHMGTTASPQHLETSSSTRPVARTASNPPPLVTPAISVPPSPAPAEIGRIPRASTSVTITASDIGPRDPAACRPAGNRIHHRPVQTETVLARIDALLAAVTACRQRGETPELVLPAKTRWQDLQLCSAAGHLVVSEGASRPEVRVRSESRLNMIMLLLQKIRHLVATNTHSTKRDIYYQEVSLFGSQRAVDALLDDVTSLLAIPRESSHVRATSKGLVAGQLVLRCGDVLMDCSAARHGVLVPENVPHVQLVSSSARFILVVEKDATFQKILDSGVLSQLPPAIVITGKGFPDLNTRLLLRMLTTRLSVPALALLDADPHGLEIFFVYKYGSLARARESARLTTPGLIWLGVRPTEVLQLEIPRSALLPLTAADRSKAHCLLSRPYVRHNRLWQRQIREILASGRKAEIQCLSAIHPTFLTDLYLPSKIQECLAGGSTAAEGPGRLDTPQGPTVATA